MSHPESVTEMSEPLLIKSAKIYALRLVLTTSNMTTITQAIEKKMQGSAAYYEDEPIVIDATTIPEEAETLNWKALVKLLQKQGFTVLGFTAPERMASAARKAGLISIELPAFENKPIVPEILVPEPLVAATTESSESVEIIAEQAAQPVESTDPASEETVPVVQAASASVADLYPGSLVIDKPLRSGQKVYAKGADLVVMGMVSHGAEVIADGNIYVFGPLRGRAMAGASGQENCKIFATQFNAELIAIAGIYRALAEVPDNLRNKPTWVHLKENKLLLEPFSL